MVSEFKLLGIIIDNNLSFQNYFKSLKKQVLGKLFSIKKIYFLPIDVKVQFFKTFIMPHFDYCSSIFIYANNTILNQICKLFNFCIFKLFNLKLNSLSIEEQSSLLSSFNILPLKLRIFYRFTIFCYKILNRKILNSFYGKFVVL